MVHTLTRTQSVEGDPDTVFGFFGGATNLQKITPPWLHFEITNAPPELETGALIEYRLRLHKVPITWLTRMEEWVPGERFVDVQVRGPYALWHHTHEFAADGPNHTVVS